MTQREEPRARPVTARVAPALELAGPVDALAQALRREEVRTRAVLEGLLDPVVTIDSTGRILFANAAVRRDFGYEPDELVGHNVKVLMPEPHRSGHDEYLERYKRTGITHILNRVREFEVVRKDGQSIRCELSVARIDVPGQDEPIFSGSFRDVTERHHMQEALAARERLLHSIFDQEFQFVGLLSTEGDLIEVNHTALASAGVRREDVVGRPFWETPWWPQTGEVRERLREAIRAAAGGKFVRYEARVLVDGGQDRLVDFSIKPLRDDDGRVTMLLPEGRDITEIRSAHEHELAMLRALATIGELAGVLAHEIKNPITAINLALRALADKLGEDQRDVLEDLVGRMQRLEQTMRRTLSFARPLDLHREPVEIADLFAAISSASGPELEAARIELAVEPVRGCVLADRALLLDVLTNLVSNAREAMPDGGRVRLSARPSGRGCFVLSIDDDGPGIAPSLREKLFKPFLTTKKCGTGLGLAICKKIVDELGGAIAVEASELGGARFSVRLPAAP
jgi:PAS domain S-box-containing protein